MRALLTSPTLSPFPQCLPVACLGSLPSTRTPLYVLVLSGSTEVWTLRIGRRCRRFRFPRGQTHVEQCSLLSMPRGYLPSSGTFHCKRGKKLERFVSGAALGWLNPDPTAGNQSQGGLAADRPFSTPVPLILALRGHSSACHLVRNMEMCTQLPPSGTAPLRMTSLHSPSAVSSVRHAIISSCHRSITRPREQKLLPGCQNSGACTTTEVREWTAIKTETGVKRNWGRGQTWRAPI
jgi:hypothetical protein